MVSTCQHTHHYQTAYSPVFGLSFNSSLVRVGSLMVSLIVGSYHSSPKGQCPTSISWHYLNTNLSSLNKCHVQMGSSKMNAIVAVLVKEGGNPEETFK